MYLKSKNSRQVAFGNEFHLHSFQVAFGNEFQLKLHTFRECKTLKMAR
jgi:hypothetical protein